MLMQQVNVRNALSQQNKFYAFDNNEKTTDALIRLTTTSIEDWHEETVTDVGNEKLARKLIFEKREVLRICQ